MKLTSILYAMKSSLKVLSLVPQDENVQMSKKNYQLILFKEEDMITMHAN